MLNNGFKGLRLIFLICDQTQILCNGAYTVVT